MTWEEVCNDPCLQDLPYKLELNQWGHIEMRPVNNRLGLLAAEIAHLLRVRMSDGIIITECAIETAKNVKVPDVTWTSFARYDAAATPEIVYTDTAPEICVEIISPGSQMEEQMHKSRLYLQAGAVEFWVCNELGDMHFFDASGALECSRLCPEFPLKIGFRR